MTNIRAFHVAVDRARQRQRPVWAWKATGHPGKFILTRNGIDAGKLEVEAGLLPGRAQTMDLVAELFTRQEETGT